jgi:hypothetical protein
MRAQGSRLVQTWVPDVRSEQFAVQAHEQSSAIAAAGKMKGDQAFIDAVSAGWDE